MNLNSITFPGLDGAYQIATDYRIVNGVKEWVNPPMEPGVEYRTAERWNGKAVWIVAYNLGTLPNNNITTLLTAPITFTEIVDVSGITYTTGGRNPISNTGGLSDLWITGGSTMNFNVKTTTDLSNKTLIVTVKYTKE